MAKFLDKFKCFAAFTLAETLIVMGIIGVVAALTIPNLNSSTADKEKVAKVMKAYSDISDAIGRAEAVYGPVNEWQQLDTNETSQIKRLGERITEFMKTSKTCGMNKSQGCIGRKIYDKTSNEFIFFNLAGDSSDWGYKVILADGMSLSISVVYGPGDWLFLYDIDGPNKGASMLGKDIFSFTIVRNSSPTELRPDPRTLTTSLNSCFQAGFCTEWVVNNGNLDYLKADTSGKCPNGKVLSETVTSCK
ncbi:MAG: hypothetical protein DKM24_08480 [Candidatus Melainabacteria bacterium]|nr:MAG: hypothetical protein DKM24_08480 [Candidatus Melainabacteria bacterium]